MKNQTTSNLSVFHGGFPHMKTIYKLKSTDWELLG